MMQWWGPDAGRRSAPRRTCDPGGRFSVVFRLLNGEEHNPTGIYQEVVPEKKLVFTWEWPGMPERESLVTFLLEPFDGGTELTLIHEHLPDEEARKSHEARLERPPRQAARFPWSCRMSDLILTTFDWVPETPRGYVRDLRVRWALEEAGLPYRVESTPFRDRKAEHFAHQPFGQVPWLTDGDLSIFESGAILLHLGELSDALMPADPRGRSEVMEWLFAALDFRRGGEPALVLVQVLRRHRRHADAGSFLTASSTSTGSSTWSRCWQDANGWPEPSPSPTS